VCVLRVRARVRVWRPLSRVSPRSSTMLIVCSRRQPCGVWLKSCTPYMCTHQRRFICKTTSKFVPFNFFFFTSPTRLRPVRTRSSARSLTRDQLAACFAWPLTTFVAVGAARGAMWGTCCVVWGPNCQRNRACRGLKRSPTLSACLCVCGQLIALCVGVCARLGYGHRRSNMLLCGRGAAP
jgi:hypothetical protein